METLRPAFKGDLLTAESPAFERAAFDGLWNQLRPSRVPQIIARVADDQDVILAVNYARENGLKVVVRGGGHNWCCPSLRSGGILIDLFRLTRVLSIDATRRIAVVEPIISNRDLIGALRPHGLAYPSGHCPTVKMSGYLLSGGMAWNHGVWGPGVGSVEAIDMVTADGALVTASREQQRELFWAARGAGPGFFAVALRYHLRLHPLPRAIASSGYYFRMGEVRRIAQWLGPLADRLPPSVELSLFMIAAPPELAEHGPKLCMVTATVFADTPEEAAAAAGPLEECPVMDRCLKRTFVEPTTFEQLFDASGAL
ncbi:MAG TPA: FAD-dependent oxidoreductase, partial [Chloroflexota bacterium]